MLNLVTAHLIADICQLMPHLLPALLTANVQLTANVLLIANALLTANVQ
jgi:hypothetical protein